MSCCELCHFKEEERKALPYLLPAERARLLRDHAILRRMPEGQARWFFVRVHACWEDALFRCRLPAQLAAHFTDDHRRLLG